MRSFLMHRVTNSLLVLLFWCFRASGGSLDPQLPADVTINKEAGRGGLLIVPLRLEGGEEAPFMVDTGATGTVLDKSWEPRLGKRLGTEPSTGWEGKGKANSYAAPKLFLGEIPLMTGSKIWTGVQKGAAGILGMDCLQRYCIQLDFAAGKMRFLKPDQVNAAELGKAFPLTLRENLPYINHVGLLGAETNLLIDIGCRIDGLGEKSMVKGLAQMLPDCVWDGKTYTNLAVAGVEHANVLGLSFLARHLVTLDFPKRTMYLKQTNVGPLTGDSLKGMANDEIGAPAEFLESLKNKGQLPGLSKDDQGATYLAAYSNFGSQSTNRSGVAYTKGYFNSSHQSVSFDFWKNGDPSIYHYQVGRTSKDSPWKLQKAWRTGKNDRTVEEYPVP
jgi:hypothetical protein